MSELGSILQDIAVLSVRVGVEVFFNIIPHDSNSVAHGLARHAFLSCYLESWDLWTFVSHDSIY